MKNLKPYIELIHLHWNDGSYDAHNAPNEEELRTFKQIYEYNSLECLVALEYNIDDIEKEIRRVRTCLK